MTGSGRTRGLAQLVVAVALVLTGAAVLTDVPATAAPLNQCVDPDNGRPAVEELSLEPSSVDVTHESQQVTVRARLVDTGGPGAAGGVVGARITLGTPHGLDVPVDLDREDGELWTGVLTVRPGSRDGTWDVRGISVFDAAGNSTGDGDELGYDYVSTFDDVTLAVVSNPDTTEPAATSLSISRAAVDTRDRAKNLRVRVGVSDVGTGVGLVAVRARRGDHQVSAELSSDGDSFVGSLRIPRWVGTGTWKISNIVVHDRAGNTKAYGGSRLDVLGERRFGVRSKTDAAAPELVSVRVDPTTIDIRRERRTVTIRAWVKDSGSGVESVSTYLLNKGVSMHRVRGTAKKGLWVGSIRRGPCADVGRTPPRRVFIDMHDRAGNEDARTPRTNLRVKARDNAAPRIRDFSRQVEPAGPVELEFSEAVNGISSAGVTVRRSNWPEPLGPELAGTWTCWAGDGTATSCAVGRARRASWLPAEPLEPGAGYRIQVNPEGVLDVTDLSGNPAGRYDDDYSSDYVDVQVVQ